MQSTTPRLQQSSRVIVMFQMSAREVSLQQHAVRLQADIEMAQTRQAAARQQAAEQRHAVQDSDGEEDEQELHRCCRA